MHARSMTKTTEAAPRSAVRAAAIVGSIIALLVAGIGIGYTLLQKPVYAATTSVVVVPNLSTDINQAASLFDSLSRGQVTATAAELYAQDRWHASAPNVKVSAGTVTPSSLLQITARGENADEVRATLSKIVDDATPQINKIVVPYQAIATETSIGAARRTGISPGLLITVSLVAAAVAGLAAFAAVRRWLG